MKIQQRSKLILRGLTGPPVQDCIVSATRVRRDDAGEVLAAAVARRAAIGRRSREKSRYWSPRKGFMQNIQASYIIILGEKKPHSNRSLDVFTVTQ